MIGPIFKNSFKTYSSMEKVMPCKMPCSEELKNGLILKNERFSFQIAYEFIAGISYRFYDVTFDIKSPLKEYISVYKVEYLPAQRLVYNHPWTKDDSIISHKPGLYPDMLNPLCDNKIRVDQDICDSLWFTLDTNGEVDAGIYDISVEFTYRKKAEKEDEEDIVYTSEKILKIEIIDALLPEQKLMYTQWFHADCLASYYKLETFSEKHWQVIENFMKVAVKNGHNVIFTPLFTPPLDTAVGGERPTTQLVDVFVNNGKYSFGFKNLDRWIDLSLDVGYKYFEMPHLFTQWGAEFCPKIMANADGEYKKIFGWENKSSSKEYREFLSAFLPAVTSYMEKRGLKENTIFHYSDEPRGDHLETYKEAVKGAAPYLEGWTVIDALSEVEYSKEGLIKNAVVPHYRSEEFFKENISNIWIYYCCTHQDYYSNRFFAYPLWRTRIMGLQLFKYNIPGFLQWGYNFYYNEHSKKLINPFRTTDGDRAFPAGDAFSVYPGDNGECLESVRLVSFYEGIQDMRALNLLADLIGKDKAIKLIDDIAGMDVTFERYPANAYFIQLLRRRVNELIKENIG